MQLLSLQNNWKTTASILGYGMIPLVLGAFMSAHLNGITSPDATFVHFIKVTGGLLASFYASQRMVNVCW